MLVSGLLRTQVLEDSSYCLFSLDEEVIVKGKPFHFFIHRLTSKDLTFLFKQVC